MLTIRLNRTGKKNRPHFRVVLQEHTKAPGKRHVEVLGSYDGIKKVAVLKKERIVYWLGQGVKTSDTVHNLLVKEGVIQDKKRVLKIPAPEKPAEVAADKKEEAVTEEVAAPAEVAKAEGNPEDEAAPVSEEAPKA